MSKCPVIFRPLFLFLFLCATTVTLCAQQPTAAEASDTKLDDIIKETQRTIGGKNSVGLVWWLPTEFWEQSALQQGSSVDQARSTFAPIREYTMIIVAVGKMGIGNINWYPESEIRSNTSLRDSGGHAYQPLTEISSDAQGISSIIKPVLANILGPMGQNIQVLFFPAKSADGKIIANPTAGGSFSVRISNLTSQKDSDFEWRLPLTSLSPPRFCPVGHERVQADWKFCPWHGVTLPEVAPLAAPSTPTAQPKKDTKPL